MDRARAEELRRWLASLGPDERDGALEARLGIVHPPTAPPGEELVGYHPAGVDSILQALARAPVRPSDVFVDLGSGLGKAVLLARMLTGAACRGVEIQPALVEAARRAADRLGVDVSYTVEDARDASLDDGTVFFVYLPFTGGALDRVLERLHAAAALRDIVVCALGVDLSRAPWLAPRRLDSFWLEIYDSAVPGARRRDGVGPNADAGV